MSSKGKIYNTQDYLTIKALLGHTLSDASDVVIKYINPFNSTGQWSAIVENEYDGIVYYSFPLSTYMTPAGNWELWAFATMADGRTIPGERAKVRIYEEGEE